ncbi:MAG: SUMF1/EgtB/PvdO family nonheme iron enzyme [Alphaproteobacteria bacterium]|nr:SUMF1/EgtB/PvdO family nonheme iron enzyme [Alphaproteobacteria bacterium]
MAHAVKLALAAMLSLGAYAGEASESTDADTTPLATIAATPIAYRLPGEFVAGDMPVNGPVIELKPAQSFTIMKRQVSEADYAACVDAGACQKLAGTPGRADDLPVVGVSWQDAEAYARWLSVQTGHRYRLPTDAEWALAAGPAYRPDALTDVADPNDPSKRWIAVYEAESKAEAVAERRPQPFGTFGTNASGVMDAGGNVWEWTSACYTRQAWDETAGAFRQTTENCGVRVVEGRHRTYMVVFIRDPRVGGCAVGRPPANLGFRLVRDDTAEPSS